MKGYRQKNTLMGLALGLAIPALVLFTDVGGSLVSRALRVSQSIPIARNGEDAVVVLTGGFERIPRALEVHRATGLPLVISGKVVREDRRVMAKLGVREYVGEPQATSTETNAAYFSCLARARGWRKVFLVTDELHMHRARAWFWWYGVSVTIVPAPLSFFADLPSQEQQAFLARSARHELGGLVDFAWAVLSNRQVPCKNAG